MTIKVLPLPRWARTPKNPRMYELRERALETYTKIYPTFNRTGFYKVDGISWMEIEDGRAFTVSVEQFDTEFGLLEVLEWPPETKELVKACASSRHLKNPKVMRMNYLIALSESESRKQKAKRVAAIKRIKNGLHL